ncbi:4'-phosphopantetheinyl transferase superfamily protein [Flavobacteriaceae bacterium]|nr:4'-phosphopantetheinyl transferase superfamily protein [Flavobacteriaceae bacterium]MDC1492056.1 4'-phosphopantetheinyl transferase superfamily protein [Flavobacteriaceae bacterium]
MPIYKSYSPNSLTTIKVWKISESYQQLLSSIDLTKKTFEKLDITKSEVKKCEILSIRHLLTEFGLSDNDLYYDKFGKPMLTLEKNISISHSKLFSAVIISDFNTSIDIEKVSNKVIGISDKFIDYESSFLGDLNKEIERLTIIWCIKECIYKISDKKLPYIFKDKCIVTPFSLNHSSVISWLKFNKLILSFKSYIHSFEGYKLVFLIQNK